MPRGLAQPVFPAHTAPTVPLIVLDTETTGCTPNQICQLAYLMVYADGPVARNYFFAVDAMNDHARAVHGMSRERLRVLSGGRRFADDADAIYADLRRARRVAGHNVAYDIKQIADELRALDVRWTPKASVCTMNFFARLTGLVNREGKTKPPKLVELCGYFGIRMQCIQEATERHFGESARAHDARYDATATYLCLAAAERTGQLTGLLETR